MKSQRELRELRELRERRVLRVRGSIFDPFGNNCSTPKAESFSAKISMYFLPIFGTRTTYRFLTK